MNPVMYIIANRGLRMSPGKLAAQVAHAAVEAYLISDEKMVSRWYRGGHHTKIVLGVDDEMAMANVEQYLKERGFKVKQIIDEGRTEIKPFSRTAIGVEIVNKTDPHVEDTFSSFKTYKPLPPENRSTESTRLFGNHFRWAKSVLTGR
jgi:PTH2 family peptidyl-tRNA hydrolase